MLHLDGSAAVADAPNASTASRRKAVATSRGRGGRGRGRGSRGGGAAAASSLPVFPIMPSLSQLVAAAAAATENASRAMPHPLPSALSHLLKSGQVSSSDSASAVDLSGLQQHLQPPQRPGSPQSAADSVLATQRLAALLSAASSMKVPPISLPSGSMNMPGLPFSPDLLWRYPNPFLPQPPPSPLESQLRAQLPGGLGHDPRCWARDDVAVFLRYCEREFDLEKIDMERFQMNGKALCLLNKNDLAERCGGAGDVIHNILQLLIREACGFPPNSPITPRPPGLMTPTSPAFPQSPHAWPLLASGAAAAAAAAAAAENGSDRNGAGANFPGLSHLISQANSVTLSPAPSLDSQNGSSPKHAEAAMAAAALAAASTITSIHQLYPPPSRGATATSSSHVTAGGRTLSVPPPLGHALLGAGRGLNVSDLGLTAPHRAHSASSSHSDSDDSLSQETLQRSPSTGGPRTPTLSAGPRSPFSKAADSSSLAKEDTPELNTNGRLLWDFLQQLLNDPEQRYKSYIAWKDRETGVFKIADPAGLAKLWGIQKNHLSMNYDKMSRALRYYYRVNILKKVQGERHCYQFLRNPSELKSIKNISLLRQQMEAQAAAQKLAVAHHAALLATGCKLDPRSESPAEADAARTASSPSSSCCDEPTDLTLDAEEKAALRRAYHRSGGAGSSSSDDRDREPRAVAFDFRHLMPQVSLKTENF